MVVWNALQTMGKSRLCRATHKGVLATALVNGANGKAAQSHVGLAFNISIFLL